MHTCISCQSPFCCTLMYAVDKLKSQLGDATPQNSVLIQRNIKVRSFKNILPCASMASGDDTTLWKYKVIELTMGWMSMSSFYFLANWSFHLIFSLIVFSFLSIGNQPDGHQSHSPTIGQPPNTIPFSEYHMKNYFKNIHWDLLRWVKTNLASEPFYLILNW